MRNLPFPPQDVPADVEPLEGHDAQIQLIRGDPWQSGGQPSLWLWQSEELLTSNASFRTKK